jgi:single-stranded DNA-binding protein
MEPLPEAEENNAQPQAEKANRVMLTGRLGRNVYLRTTATGRVIGRVPLAVHRGEETDWHVILFFDEKAQKAAEQLAKGQLVNVVGYKHYREIKGKDGNTKQVEEIYAVDVPTRK